MVSMGGMRGIETAAAAAAEAVAQVRVPWLLFILLLQYLADLYLHPWSNCGEAEGVARPTWATRPSRAAAALAGVKAEAGMQVAAVATAVTAAADLRRLAAPALQVQMPHQRRALGQLSDELMT